MTSGGNNFDDFPSGVDLCSELGRGDREMKLEGLKHEARRAETGEGMQLEC